MSYSRRLSAWRTPQIGPPPPHRRFFYPRASPPSPQIFSREISLRMSSPLSAGAFRSPPPQGTDLPPPLARSAAIDAVGRRQRRRASCCLAASRRPPPSTGDHFGSQWCSITSNGECVTDGTGNYGNNERCTIRAEQSLYATATYLTRVAATTFRLPAGGGEVTGPVGIAMAAGATMTWYTDGSVTGGGFTICASPAPPPLPPFPPGLAPAPPPPPPSPSPPRPPRPPPRPPFPPGPLPRRRRRVWLDRNRRQTLACACLLGFSARLSPRWASVCAGAWRHRLIRNQLMGTNGISEATGTVTSKHVSVSTHRNHDGNQHQMTTYHVSYNSQQL